MIRIVRWNPDTRTAEGATVEQLPASHATLTEGHVVWIDLENPTAEEERQIFEQFLPVHPLTHEDITKPRREPEGGPHFPKVEEFPDYLFVIVNPLPLPAEPDPNKKQAMAMQRFRKKDLPQLSAILTHTVLITHHYAAMPCVFDSQRHLARHATNLGRGPDYVFHLILDGIVDEYAPVVESISDRLDRMEGKMFENPTQEMLFRLLRIKRQVTYLRKTLILEREVLARLIRGEFHLVDTREIAYYRNVYDHLTRYTELIENAREMVSDLLQTHLSAVSNRMNSVMKVLTMISTVILPMTLIAGVYGMNFAVLPEKDWTWGYPFALGLMAMVGVTAFIWFKRKGWI